jgi:hypothetical protein
MFSVSFVGYCSSDLLKHGETCQRYVFRLWLSLSPPLLLTCFGRRKLMLVKILQPIVSKWRMTHDPNDPKWDTSSTILVAVHCRNGRPRCPTTTAPHGFFTRQPLELADGRWFSDRDQRPHVSTSGLISNN